MAKNILADFDYELYHNLLDWAADEDVHVVHTHGYQQPLKGGFTFAWRRCSEFARGRMVEVAVTFCSPRDTFCRKIGTLYALSNFENGSTIQLPVGSEDSAEIVEKLRYIFIHSALPRFF